MLTALPGFFLENREQSQWRYKERKDKHPEQEVIHKFLVVEDHVGGKDELVMSGSIIVRPCSVRMIKPKLGAYGDEFVWPPGNTDGMLRIVRSETRSASHLVLKVLVPDGEECIPGNPEHRIIADGPLGCIAIPDRK